MVPSDEQLMAAYAEGDPEAFEALYARHRDRILGYLFSRLRDRDEAEEVFQTVFAKLHASRDRYREDIPFLPWVFTICRNALVDHLRKVSKYRRREVLTDDPGHDIPAPTSSGGSIDNIIAGMSSLTPSQRAILELRFEQGFSFNEIAGRLETSTANARQIVSRTIRHLRQRLGERRVR